MKSSASELGLRESFYQAASTALPQGNLIMQSSIRQENKPLKNSSTISEAPSWTKNILLTELFKNDSVVIIFDAFFKSNFCDDPKTSACLGLVYTSDGSDGSGVVRGVGIGRTF